MAPAYHQEGFLGGVSCSASVIIRFEGTTKSVLLHNDRRVNMVPSAIIHKQFPIVVIIVSYNHGKSEQMTRPHGISLLAGWDYCLPY